MGEPAVEVVGVALTAVVEVKEESSVEVLEARASVEKKVGGQAMRTVDATIHDIVEEETGIEPVLMDVDAIRTGVEPLKLLRRRWESRVSEQGMNLFMRL